MSRNLLFFFFMFFLHFGSIRDMFESWGNFTGTEYLGQPWVAGTHPAVSYAISLVFWTHHKRVDNSWQRIPGVCLLRSTRPVRAKALLRPRVASQTDPNPSMANLFPPTLILIQSHYTKQNANKTLKNLNFLGALYWTKHFIQSKMPTFYKLNLVKCLENGPKFSSPRKPLQQNLQKSRLFGRVPWTW